jgi:glycosyltransferase involved in cell wall biosynthesis
VLVSANSAWNIVNFRLGLLRALKGAGYDVAVAAPADGHEKDLDEFRFLPIPMERSGMNPVADLQLLARYRTIMRDVMPAAYLGFTIKPNVYGSIAARMARVPTINNISGLGTMFLGRGWQSRLAHALYRVALRRSATVFFQNPDDLCEFVETRTVRAEQATLLPGSGIDLDRFKPAPVTNDGPPLFLFVGRLLADKGVREFVDAARMVRAALPRARFRLVGGLDSGNRSAIGADEVEGWRQSGSVELIGEAEDVRPHLAAATAVVLPSYREGMPRVLLEAAAMGRPLIASDVPGCNAIVSPGENGLLCKPRDAQSLAEAMLQMAALPAERRLAMGSAARQTAQRNFDQRLVFDAYLSALRDIHAATSVGRS